MYCKYCGKTIVDKWIYCQHCGRLIEKDNIDAKANIDGNSNVNEETNTFADFNSVFLSQKNENKIASENRENQRAKSVTNTSYTNHSNNNRNIYAELSSIKPQEPVKRSKPPIIGLVCFCALGGLFAALDNNEKWNSFTDSLQYLNVKLYILLLGLILTFIGYLIKKKSSKEVNKKRIVALSGEEKVGGTINLMGITYIDTEKHISNDVFCSFNLNTRNSCLLSCATVQYQFITLFYIPIFPVGCHCVYVETDISTGNALCKLFARCKINLVEILQIYFIRWGILITLISIVLFLFAL